MKCVYHESNSTHASRFNANYVPQAGVTHVGPANTINQREEWAHDYSVLILDGRRWSDLLNGLTVEVYYDPFRRVTLRNVED
jgi:hypothetical protein